MNKIPVSRLWQRKSKYEYVVLKQLIEAFPKIQFDFHIVLDQSDYSDEWTEKIDALPINVTYYTREQMHEYASNYIDGDKFDFKNFIHSYHIVIGHYLRRVRLFDYMLTYDSYDVIFNDEDLSEVENCLLNKIPFGIIEPLNSGCDKALYQNLCQIFQTDISKIIAPQNPNFLGINAGFQGVNLRMFDEFLSQSGFATMMSLFDFSGVYKEDGTEKWGAERTYYDTQEQSFYGLLNQVYSPNFLVLDPNKYYFHPCWEDTPGYIEKAMESKIVHFTGHAPKAKKLYELLDKKLNQK